MKRLPVFLKQYFWDVDFNKLDFERSKTFILKRVLDRGDNQTLKWLFQNYTKEDIKELILTTRDLSAKTANFWADYLHIAHNQVPCLQKPYSRIQFGLSS
ncbi:TPA: hypothetical protein DD690_03570 [Candidatus Daviesbacteria bacterium]|nr:MAG: hypothetical protein A3D02_03185 [Candidatus Daviesbacteria bacterium RIFCSPHIGHO2_02_FULL_39_41]OGE45772.1 MAG: hypothetical protein A3E67_03380 [Candidatus Daviesbacteria bacterium RIFCSPHIGHO2_12_FULL_38_25]OGE68987.1 MAG: hypothetical protein A3H81_03490 [Candidatus Daviesbacteria bacterium RIFCSPLOWO2_02_FULL_38_18]HBQ51035.1 hypothetical protein [Candidatus Daviesbacteria bacterium]HCB23172.1 hypothetical protein [Candidatus Daviesbacteria bacterium]